MQNEYEIKKEMCEIGRRVYNRGMVAANDGNFSVKLNDHEFLCTPTGVSKGFMTPEYICKVDENGNVLQANKGFRPSSEIKMHMRVYRERPDVQSVVHAHPLYATTFAIAGIPLTQPIMPEAVIALGCVPIAKSVHLLQWRFRTLSSHTFSTLMQFFLRTTEHLHIQTAF